MIKVITFDLDGVYFLNGKENFITNLVKLGVSEDKAKEVFLKSDKMNKEYKTGLISDEEFWTWALKEWGLAINPSEIINLLISGYQINQAAVELAKKLRSHGYQTAICSNNFSARVNGLNQKFNFLADFDVVIFSHEIGILKPDKRIFEALIKKSQTNPDQIAYSDDDPEKLKGAIELGIKTFVYQNFNQFCRELRNLGVKIG